MNNWSLLNIFLNCLIISIIAIVGFCLKAVREKREESKKTDRYSVNPINEDYPIIKCKIRMAKERTTNHSYVPEGNLFDKLEEGSIEINIYIEKHQININNICSGVY